MTTPSVIASIIVGASTWRKRRRLNAQDPRRTRTLADFFDKLVCIFVGEGGGGLTLCVCVVGCNMSGPGCVCVGAG
jgi:hypothetical protein